MQGPPLARMFSHLSQDVIRAVPWTTGGWVGTLVSGAVVGYHSAACPAQSDLIMCYCTMVWCPKLGATGACPVWDVPP